MRILLVSQDGVGSWFTLRLMEDGHSVDYYLLKSKYKYVLNNIVPTPLLAKPDFKKYDLVFFDLTGSPKLAEEAYQATNVLGDGNFATQAEEDRLFGIQIMEECGIEVPPYEVFNNTGEAKKFIKSTGKRYVFKPFGDQDTAATYVSDSADDLLDYLDKLSRDSSSEFLLQEVVDGTEVSTEGWFNGEDFFLINNTLEEKKFMNHGKGPNTGCAGNLVFVHDLHRPKIFRDGLERMTDFLRSYGYRGMIDLNTIVTETTAYGLEWTPRCGYDATATLFHIISSDLGEFLFDIAAGNRPNYNIKRRFAASIRLSIPPYPSEIEGHHPDGIPIKGLTDDLLTRKFYLYDAEKQGDEFVTAGVSGFVGCPIASGDTIGEAFDKVKELTKNVKIPNVQYRTDIRDRCLKRYNILDRQGWLR